MEKLLCFEHASITDRGCVRESNADYVGSYLPSSKTERSTAGSLFLVADGVGGAEDGRKAGKIAVHHIFSHYYENSIVDPMAHLRAAIENANYELFEMSTQSGQEGSYATTIVAALVHRQVIYFASVGDSRAYLIDEHRIDQVTTDHTLVNHLLQKGVITRDEAIVHPKRNVITRSLGVRRNIKIDFFTRNPAVGDTVVLCSDGLTRYVFPNELFELSQSFDVESLPDRLLSLAKDRGGRDNISANIIRFTGVEEL